MSELTALGLIKGEACLVQGCIAERLLCVNGDCYRQLLLSY